MRLEPALLAKRAGQLWFYTTSSSSIYTVSGWTFPCWCRSLPQCMEKIVSKLSTISGAVCNWKTFYFSLNIFADFFTVTIFGAKSWSLMRTFLYQVYYFCGKSTPVQAGYNDWLRVLQLPSLPLNQLHCPSLMDHTTGGTPSIVPQLGNTLQYDVSSKALGLDLSGQGPKHQSDLMTIPNPSETQNYIHPFQHLTSTRQQYRLSGPHCNSSYHVDHWEWHMLNSWVH